jgi:hypothetical protein
MGEYDLTIEHYELIGSLEGLCKVYKVKQHGSQNLINIFNSVEMFTRSQYFGECYYKNNNECCCTLPT